MEEEQGVPRAESEGLLGCGGRLTVAAVRIERPGEGVGDVDARALLPLGTGGAAPPAPSRTGVIRFEERDLEVGVHAVRAEETRLRTDEVELSGGGVAITGLRVEISESGHVLG